MKSVKGSTKNFHLLKNFSLQRNFIFLKMGNFSDECLRQRFVRALAFCFCMLCVLTGASAAPYPFRQDEPDTGSSIRRIIGNSSFPLDHRYPDFTKDERANFLTSVSTASTSDTPTYPQESLKPLVLRLSKLRNSLIQSNSGIIQNSQIQVSLLVHIDASGKAQSVSIISSTSSDLSALLTNSLIQPKYSVAMCSGQPCSSDFPFSMSLDF